MKLLTSFLLLCPHVSCSQQAEFPFEKLPLFDTIFTPQVLCIISDSCPAVEVRDPWDSTRLLQRYLLVDRDRPVPENLLKGDWS